MEAPFIENGLVAGIEDIGVGLASFGANLVHRTNPLCIKMRRIGQEEDAGSRVSVV
jgi:hypothetical protein